MGQLVVPDPLPVVLHADDDLVPLGLRHHLDPATHWRVPQGVVQEVGEDLPETLRVDRDPDRRDPRSGALQHDALVVVPRPDRGDGRLEQPVDGHLPQVEGEPPLLCAAHVLQVGGEPGQPAHLLGHHPAGLRAPCRDSVVERLEVGRARGEGGPHLVREVGEEPAPGVLGRLQAHCHLVEGLREHVELGTRTGRRHPSVVAPARDRPGGGGEVVQGTP